MGLYTEYCGWCWWVMGDGWWGLVPFRFLLLSPFFQRMGGTFRLLCDAAVNIPKCFLNCNFCFFFLCNPWGSRTLLLVLILILVLIQILPMTFLDELSRSSSVSDKRDWIDFLFFPLRARPLLLLLLLLLRHFADGYQLKCLNRRFAHFQFLFAQPTKNGCSYMPVERYLLILARRLKLCCQFSRSRSFGGAGVAKLRLSILISRANACVWKLRQHDGSNPLIAGLFSGRKMRKFASGTERFLCDIYYRSIRQINISTDI